MIGRFRKQILNTDQKSISRLFSKGFIAAKARDERWSIQDLRDRTRNQ